VIDYPTRLLLLDHGVWCSTSCSTSHHSLHHQLHPHHHRLATTSYYYSTHPYPLPQAPIYQCVPDLSEFGSLPISNLWNHSHSDSPTMSELHSLSPNSSSHSTSMIIITPIPKASHYWYDLLMTPHPLPPLSPSNKSPPTSMNPTTIITTIAAMIVATRNDATTWCANEVDYYTEYSC
jgi:hypothetical protein